MANPTDSTGTNPTQDQPDELTILGILMHRREQFEAAYERWRDRIGQIAVDTPMSFSDAGNPVVAMLLMQHKWLEITEAIDRRFKRLP